MYRQERSSRQSYGDITSIEENGEVRRAPKTLPSGSQLPACWNEAMDRAICHMEAQNEVEPTTMTRLLKRRFPELEGHVIPTDAIERRIETLELQVNDFFKAGMEAAIANVEAKGFILPSYDPLNYPRKHYPLKSDEEVFGSGGPMGGTLGYGASNVQESSGIARGIASLHVGGRSKFPEKKIALTQPPAKQASAHNEGIGHRRNQLAGELSHPRSLTDISNTYNAPEIPVTSSSYRKNSPERLPSSKYEKGTINPAPSTPVNSHGAQKFSTPSSRNRNHGGGDTNSTPSSHHHSTPTTKAQSHSKGEVRRTPTVGSSSGGLYRSEGENAASGMSTSTTGTSILGRDVSGMSAALERRQFRIDQRLHAND